jgi:hypothetical protein
MGERSCQYKRTGPGKELTPVGLFESILKRTYASLDWKSLGWPCFFTWRACSALYVMIK